MKKTEYHLNAAKCRNEEEFYDQVSRLFSFPDYFGRNLDALDECLFDKIDESNEITEFVLLETSKFLCAELSDRRDLVLNAFISMFLDAMIEFPGKVTIHLE